MNGRSGAAFGAAMTASAPLNFKPSTAELAKASFRRLAKAQLEPTPENYAQAYALEVSSHGEDALASVVSQPAVAAPETGSTVEIAMRHRAVLAGWASLVERLARGLERGGRHWTVARRRDSMLRVFDSSRSDPMRMHQRLHSLTCAWEDDSPNDNVLTDSLPESDDAVSMPEPAASEISVNRVDAAPDESWADVLISLERTVRTALPVQDPSAAALADRLSAAAQELANAGINAARVEHIGALCTQARVLLGQRHQVVHQLSTLCHELTAGLSEVAEDGSWVKGQCEAVQACLPPPGSEPNMRMIRGAGAVLADARRRQKDVQHERQSAQTALKSLIQNMLLEVGDLGEQTGRFQAATAAHAQTISQANSLEELTGVVQTLLDDSRAVQQAVRMSHERLHADKDRASELENRVLELEGELRRLSDEVSTDALTQVSNRRGLAQAFAVETSRVQRLESTCLSIGLIDIDNFKKLNDSLGHAAGDVALKNLASQVQARLRPGDHLARFGGEEFVVLIPGSPVQEAQQALTRLQRSLTEALFLHEGREVFVTFSGGVTTWQLGETLEAALGRADLALYEAKRTGKNKTCLA